MPGTWIFGETAEQLRELASAALALGITPVTGLSVQAQESAEALFPAGIDEVLILPALPEGQAIDAWIPTIAEEAKKADPALILVAATARGKDLAARLAARLGAGLCSNCIALAAEPSGAVRMDRLAYGGAAVQRVECATRPAMATIPPRTYEPAQPVAGRSGRVRELPLPPASPVRVL